jgi:hypothetical protein
MSSGGEEGVEGRRVKYGIFCLKEIAETFDKLVNLCHITGEQRPPEPYLIRIRIRCRDLMVSNVVEQGIHIQQDYQRDMGGDFVSHGIRYKFPHNPAGITNYHARVEVFVKFVERRLRTRREPRARSERGARLRIATTIAIARERAVITAVVPEGIRELAATLSGVRAVEMNLSTTDDKELRGTDTSVDNTVGYIVKLAAVISINREE